MIGRLLGGALVAAVFAGLCLGIAPARAEEPFCFECHDDFPAKLKAAAFAHEPAASGDCTACHLDHKDEEKLMLVKEGADLCLECHDAMASGASVHAPVKDGKCTSCHDPHGSGTKKLLVAAGAKLCEKCHGGSPEFGRKVLHTALDDGCSSCHLPHNSPNPKLLAKNLLLDRLALFDAKQAELCFECHDQGAYTALQGEDSGFRMGKSNLHAVHLLGGGTPNKYGIVKRKDGQTCFACHLPHSSEQDMLLRSEYQCTGTFCYTMRFVKSDKGGTCIVGCHKPRTYSRDGSDPNSTAGLAPSETGQKPVVR